MQCYPLPAVWLLCPVAAALMQLQVLRLGDGGGAVADQAVVALLVRRFCGLVVRPAVGAGNDWFA